MFGDRPALRVLLETGTESEGVGIGSRQRSAIGAVDCGVRAQLIRVRTQAINLRRAQLRQEGYRLGSGSADTPVTRSARLDVPPTLDDAVAPIRELLA